MTIQLKSGVPKKPLARETFDKKDADTRVREKDMGHSAFSLWPFYCGAADFGGATAAAELGFDGGTEAVAAVGVLALQA